MPIANLVFEQVQVSDVEALQELSRRSFLDSFYHQNKPEDIMSYVDKAFSSEQLTKELGEKKSQFHWVKIEGILAGYLKINFGSAQTELKDPEALEIERIYVLNDFQRKSIGQALMAKAIAIARQEQLKYLWLGVWEHNLNAIRFYEIQGFVRFSAHSFLLGNDLQTDILMKLKL